MRWKEIKRLFSHRYIQSIGSDQTPSASRLKRKEVTIWQRRFWEHTIRDEEDLNRHIDYIHFNPVKHGLVRQVSDWQWSSFHHYVKEGFYPADWGQADDNFTGMTFGE